MIFTEQLILSWSGKLLNAVYYKRVFQIQYTYVLKL